MNQERTRMRLPSESAVAQRAAYQEVKRKQQQREETGCLEVAEKKCFKCLQTKPLSEYYKHPQMADGRLNKCKACTKSDAAKHRDENHAKVCEYDRWRFAADKERKKSSLEYQRARRIRNPEKDRARNAVNNAVRDGKLEKLPCEICGRKAQAHHDDYSKPLDVRWLCFEHHRSVAHGQRVESKDYLP